MKAQFERKYIFLNEKNGDRIFCPPLDSKSILQEKFGDLNSVQGRAFSEII